MSDAERTRHFDDFEAYEKYNKKPLSKAVFIKFFRNRDTEDDQNKSRAFDLADRDQKGYLDMEDFAVACHLTTHYNLCTLPLGWPLESIHPTWRYAYLVKS